MDLTSASSTQQHLKSIQQMVLSRTNLEAIIGQYRDGLPELKSLNMDESVERLLKQIKVSFSTEVDGRGAIRVLSFTISAQNRDAEMARTIAQELSKRFIDEDQLTRSLHVSGTTTFLKDELKKRETELEESDTNLTLLKGKHLYELPTRLEWNQRDLERLNDSKRSNEENLNRLISARLGYEQLLALTPEFLETPPKPSPLKAIKEKDPNVDIFLKTKADWDRERVLRREGHPDYDQAKSRMEKARALVPPDVLEEILNPKTEENVEVAQEKTKNPNYLHLQNQMRELETEYKIRVNEKKAIEESIARVARRVDSTPLVELQMTGVVRDNEDLRKERDQLKDDFTKALLSETLEQRDGSSLFQIVDPPNLPIEPEKPNKWAILGIGCLFSLLLAIGFAFIVDLARQRVWTQSEIESLWGVPVMVDIPAIVSDGDQAELRRKRLAFATFFLAAFTVYGAFLYGVYLNNNYILQQLDPVLQTLVYR
jgi:capsular polysaccharide biosynthesis protein